MSLVRLQQVVRRYGAELIVGPVDLTLHPHDRIGLIGPNGSGKSTLLRTIAGEEPDEGRVVYARGSRIGHLKQELDADLNLSLFQYALKGFDYLTEVESRLAQLEARMADPAVQGDPAALSATLASYHALIDQYHQDGGLEKESRARAALLGLGFAPGQFDNPLSTLSGGQKARAQLAQVLLATPDLLLLDEPTNHLDLESIEWLESHLAGYPKALLLVSHDRRLLERVVGKVWEIEGTQVVVYACGYQASRVQAAERRARMSHVYAQDAEERARLEAYVRKYKAGSRAAQAKSRQKRLDRMEAVPPPPKEPPRATITLPKAPRSEKAVCIASDVSLGYGTAPVLAHLDLAVERGDRIGIAGPNGAGKSTIIRCIAQELAPMDGVLHMGRGVIPLYYAQERHDLAVDETVLSTLAQLPGVTEMDARHLLARFLFRGDDVFKRVGALSGGEKSRLALARLLMTPGNLLLLDEPTNHLDISMREALQEAIEGYDGTLIFITHDRSLLSAWAKRIWWVEEGAVHVIDGGYDALLAWLTERRAGEAGRGTAGASAAPQAPRSRSDLGAGAGDGRREGRREGRGGGRKSGGDRRPSAETARRSGHDRAALQRLEAEMAQLAAEKERLEAALADPALYADGDRIGALSAEYARVCARLEEVEEAWIDVAAAVEDASLP